MSVGIISLILEGDVLQIVKVVKVTDLTIAEYIKMGLS
jgi:hypothetical protein